MPASTYSHDGVIIGSLISYRSLSAVTLGDLYSSHSLLMVPAHSFGQELCSLLAALPRISIHPDHVLQNVIPTRPNPTVSSLHHCYSLLLNSIFIYSFLCSF